MKRNKEKLKECVQIYEIRKGYLPDYIAMEEAIENSTKLKDKALEYIEKLCLVYENSNKKDLENVQKIIDNIYKFAHCTRGKCNNPHEDWKKDLEKQDWEI